MPTEGICGPPGSVWFKLRKPAPELLLLFGTNGGFGGLKTNFGMSAVTEGFVDAGSASAKREAGLGGEGIWIAVDVHDFDESFRIFDAIGAIRTNDYSYL